MKTAPVSAGAAADPRVRELLETALRAGPLEICASGVSMRPALRPGDRVRLERREARHGDVALVVASGRVVLHRLLRRRCGHWLVRGDARPAVDGWVSPEQVLAIATARRRNRGFARSADWQRLDRPLARWLGLSGAPLLRLLRRARAKLAQGAEAWP